MRIIHGLGYKVIYCFSPKDNQIFEIECNVEYGVGYIQDYMNIEYNDFQKLKAKYSGTEFIKYCNHIYELKKGIIRILMSKSKLYEFDMHWHKTIESALLDKAEFEIKDILE